MAATLRRRSAWLASELWALRAPAAQGAAPELARTGDAGRPPRRAFAEYRELKRTPLYDFHVKHGGALGSRFGRRLGRRHHGSSPVHPRRLASPVCQPPTCERCERHFTVSAA